MGTIAGKLQDWDLITAGDPDGEAMVKRAREAKERRKLADERLKESLATLTAAVRERTSDRDYRALTAVVLELERRTQGSSAAALRCCCLGLADELIKAQDEVQRRLTTKASNHFEIDRVVYLLELESERILAGTAEFAGPAVSEYVRAYWHKRRIARG